jgi:F0F1-type ATP synthase assembly protein I
MPASRRASVGEAFTWASRIIAVGVAMFLPAVAGSWLDERLGTGFFAIVGLAVGFTAGLAWLIQMTTRKRG